MDRTGQPECRESKNCRVRLPAYLARLEAESIHILRDGVAEAENPVLLFSAGKDSTVLAHLALRAFYPAPPPMTFLHVDSTWEFQELLEFRDRFADSNDLNLKVAFNEEGRSLRLNPIDHGDRYTSLMRTETLKNALDDGEYDIIFGGARRDEEATRAKERIVSVRERNHVWEPRHQRPELWSLYNWRRGSSQTLRAFPLSNWTELDLWHYIVHNHIELAPLYYAKARPVIETKDGLIVLDERERLEAFANCTVRERTVRFRTLGCWPVTCALESHATTAPEVAAEVLLGQTSERMGRVSDAGSLEHQKRNGYF